uniref:Uncharacterized protein n=1 Tax=viral metagenome TaxID=1070528 RepID=A0A6H2A6I7_9ZZZZ
MTAAEFWEERFKESPQNDAEKLAVAMMTEYADYVYAKFIKETMDVELALKINKLVHNECKEVPHDIGLRIEELVRLHQ